MSRARSSQVKTRNVRLNIETYDRLDKYATELVAERRSRKVTMDDAVVALLDAHDKARKK